MRWKFDYLGKRMTRRLLSFFRKDRYEGWTTDFIRGTKKSDERGRMRRPDDEGGQRIMHAAEGLLGLCLYLLKF